MKIVIQCASGGSVTVDNKIISEIGPGAVCLVGIHRDDKEEDLDWMVEQLMNLQLWDSQTIRDTNNELLLVSQFTLHARVCTGRRPDFSRAMAPETARMMFDKFVSKVRKCYNAEKVKTGEFGAMMQVKIISEGQIVTIDSSVKKL